MRFGRFGTFPIRFGGGKAEAQRIYEGMRDGRGERFATDDDTDDNKTLRCTARQIAIAASYQRRGAHQAHATLATDLLPDWERRLGVVANPRDNAYARRRLLGAILAGNGPPDSDTIAAALESALGESVALVTGTAPALKSALTTIYTPSVSLAAIAGSGSSLLAGQHSIVVAWETATGIYANQVTQSVTIAAGNGVRTPAFPLSQVSGAIAVHFYMSAAAGSSSLAWVATTNGAAVDLYDYPGNPGTPGLHHVSVIVSDAVANDRGQRAKIHEVIGTMLPAWTTYNIATSSPFELGVSLLGEGSF
jgi:hypothetical protein